MSWYPDLHIGELRPWPDAVYVWRGKTGESQRYLPDDFCALARGKNEMRELVRDMWRDGMCECDERGACTTCEYGYLDRMRELGIEVDA